MWLTIGIIGMVLSGWIGASVQRGFYPVKNPKRIVRACVVLMAISLLVTLAGVPHSGRDDSAICDTRGCQ